GRSGRGCAGEGGGRASTAFGGLRRCRRRGKTCRDRWDCGSSRECRSSPARGRAGSWVPAPLPVRSCKGNARYRELSARFLAIASTMGADLSEEDIRRTTEIVRRLSDEPKERS